MTPAQFADEIGVQRSGMSHLISGRNKPSLEFVMKILSRFPDVRPDYLLYGITDTGPAKVAMSATPVEHQQTIPATLFDQPDKGESKTERAEVRTDTKPQRVARRERSDRKIEKIVVFYDDRTFREYEPE